MGESVPVQIIWSREEDIRSGHYRPLFVHKLRGSVDASGMPEAWASGRGRPVVDARHQARSRLYGAGYGYSFSGWLFAGAFWGILYGTSYQIPNHRVESHNAPRSGIVPQSGAQLVTPIRALPTSVFSMSWLTRVGLDPGASVTSHQEPCTHESGAASAQREKWLG